VETKFVDGKRPMGRTSLVVRQAASLFCAIILVAQAPVSLFADEPRVDRDEALMQIRAWRKSFATIQVYWRDWHRQDFIDSNPGIDPDQALGKTDGSHCEFAWADFGAFRKQMTVFKQGRAVFRDAMGTPGNRPWGADSKYGESVERWDHIQLYRPDAERPLSSNFVVKGIYGLWNGRGHWFSDDLTGTDVEFVGYEQVDGHRCLIAKRMTEKRGDTYWLDPKQHYLPRQYRVTGPSKDGAKLWFTWIVAEFQVLENGMPFPAYGNLLEVDQGQPGFTWIIDRVVLNESLPRSFFDAPRPQADTRVTDYDKMEAYLGGPKTGAAARPNAQRATAQNKSPAVARPESFPWAWVAVFAAIILAGGVLMRWWRRSREN
jgi:hypothetical protein